MVYLGSKIKITKYIIPIMQKIIDDNNIENYIEPFVGGANVIDKIKCKNRIGSDINRYLIALFNNLDKLKTMPDFITKEEYYDVKKSMLNNDGKYEDWYIGAVGFIYTYFGKFFIAGYVGNRGLNNGDRKYYIEHINNLQNQIPNLKNIIFKNLDYRELDFPSNSLIYCDIPYLNTTKYFMYDNFDYDYFWEWVREKSKNNIVIISEQTAPDDFKVIWQQKINNGFSKKNEKLFIKENNYERLFNK